MTARSGSGDAPLPSSFDDNSDFYNENRLEKFVRRLKEEPLIPLGCLLTCWALFGAARSMRRGDGETTNKFFRRRIYAQGFTICAMLAGSIYWKEDRDKRKEFEAVVKEKQAKEKRDAWIRELEARDEEDKAMRAKMAKRREREKQRRQEELAAKAREGAEEAQAKEAGAASKVKEGIEALNSKDSAEAAKSREIAETAKAAAVSGSPVEAKTAEAEKKQQEPVEGEEKNDRAGVLSSVGNWFTRK